MPTNSRIMDENVSGTVYTADLNDALEAIDTSHSGTTAPTDELANGKLWLDTSSTPAILKVYNNAAWEIAGSRYGDNDKAFFGDSADLQVYHDGTDSYIKDAGTGTLRIQSSPGFNLQTTTGENYLDAIENGLVRLYHDNSAKLTTTATGVDVTGVLTTDGLTTSADINFGDNDKAIFGASSDLNIYHDSANSYIDDTGTGGLNIKSSTTNIQNTSGNTLLRGTGNVASLYNAGSERLATTSTGIDLTGDGSTTNLTGANTFKVRSNQVSVTNSGGTETMASFTANGAATLYHNNNSKLATTSGGVSVTGTVTATTFSGSGASLTNIPLPTGTGSVGTYGFFQYNSGNINPGTTVAGSSILYASTNSGGFTTNGSPGGTWKLMGAMGNNQGSVFLRIS